MIRSSEKEWALPRWGLKGIGSEEGKVRASKSSSGKSIRSFVLRTYIVGRMGVKLHIDWREKVVPASPRGT